MLSNGRLYASVLVRGVEDVEDASRLLVKVYEEGGEESLTRLALMLGRWSLTPYFPASANIKGGRCLVAALLYPNDMAKALERGKLDELAHLIVALERELKALSRELGAMYAGIDLSLSPWMEESVGELVEAVAGARIPEPGTFHAIVSLNKEISRLAKLSGVLTTGFNEVMLPLAEDALHKERGREGVLRLRDLVMTASACVAGLDMALVNVSRLGEDGIKRLLLDLLAVYEVKRRPLGVRLILTEERVGEEVLIGEFGYVPVIDV